ncbi:MAG: SGNH/GDSL hydrolase family protein [Planctomycetes bacterium]|nr:SGNH/GDSL hydrolase family protein [Planctomycetota bacterium]
MINRLLGYLVTLALLLLVFEGCLRLGGCAPAPAINRFHPTLGWEKEPAARTARSTSEFDVTFAINGAGMRGAEVAKDRAAGARRVLFVGDSFTLGYAVNEDDLFLRLFERALRAGGHEVEILNGGTEGYSTDQELLWLEEQGLSYAPDFVVLAPYLNDVYWNTQESYFDKPKPCFTLAGNALARGAAALADPGKTPWWRAHTAIGSFVQKLRLLRLSGRHTVKIGGQKAFLEDAPLLKAEPAQIEAAWRVTGELLKRFAAAVLASGARPLALIIPNRWEIHGDATPPRGLPGFSLEQLDAGAPTRRFADLCAQAGFTVIDPCAALAAQAAAGERLYYEKDWHWNAAGNRVVAEVLLERFSAPDLLGPGSNPAAAPALAAVAPAAAPGGIAPWIVVPALIALLLGLFYWRSVKGENPVLAVLKVALLVAFVAGVIFGFQRLMDALSPAARTGLGWALALLVVLFIVWKTARRLGSITELYGSFLRRGHWYLLPLLVVVLSIGMLLVVAASSPFVAPFIYTLF